MRPTPTVSHRTIWEVLANEEVCVHSRTGDRPGGVLLDTVLGDGGFGQLGPGGQGVQPAIGLLPRGVPRGLRPGTGERRPGSWLRHGDPQPGQAGTIGFVAALMYLAVIGVSVRHGLT